MKNVKSIIIVCLSLLVLLAGCGQSLEKKLEGSWYAEGKETPNFILYSDGTCEVKGEYGTGTWAIVNDDELKITNFYGQTLTVTVVSVKNGCLTLESSGTRGVLYNSYKEKTTNQTD